MLEQVEKDLIALESEEPKFWLFALHDKEEATNFENYGLSATAPSCPLIEVRFHKNDPPVLAFFMCRERFHFLDPGRFEASLVKNILEAERSEYSDRRTKFLREYCERTGQQSDCFPEPKRFQGTPHFADFGPKMERVGRNVLADLLTTKMCGYVLKLLKISLSLGFIVVAFCFAFQHSSLMDRIYYMLLLWFSLLPALMLDNVDSYKEVIKTLGEPRIFYSYASLNDIQSSLAGLAARLEELYKIKSANYFCNMLEELYRGKSANYFSNIVASQNSGEKSLKLVLSSSLVKSVIPLCFGKSRISLNLEIVESHDERARIICYWYETPNPWLFAKAASEFIALTAKPLDHLYDNLFQNTSYFRRTEQESERLDFLHDYGVRITENLSN